MQLFEIAPLLMGICLTVAGCASDPKRPHAPEPGPTMEAAFHFRPAAQARGAWIVLLPGASGLTIFDDKDHYFRAAQRLNAEGFDVLVVDYKAAYRAAANPPMGSTGEKIAWAAEQAVAWAQASGKITSGQPCAIVAWSLGAEGLWPLLADNARVAALNLRATAAYYPSNENSTPLRTAIPILILTGEADNVTEARNIHAMVDRANSILVTLHVYPDAHHGFDIASIPQPRTVRLLPLIGPSATFAYHEEASRLAAAELAEFLKRHAK